MNGHAVRGLGLAVGSALLLASAVPAAAQSAAEVVDGYLAAVNAHDAGAEFAALAPDVVIYDVARDSIVVGAEGQEAASRRLAQIRDWFEEYSGTREVVERMVSDNLVMQRERWTLRFENGGTNEWVEPAIYRVFNGKIHRMWSLPREFFDPESVPPVADPAFAPGEGPVVWIDEAHRELHRAEGTYWPLAELLRRDGYRVRAWTRTFTDSLPGRGDVLVVSNALAERNVGDWSLPTPSAFTPAEVERLAAWVRDGGGLLLIADHMPFPGAAAELAAAFGFELDNGFAIDTAAADPSPAYAPFSGSGTFTYRRADGSLAPHPIREGRGPGTRVDSVFTDAGHAFRAPPGAAPLYRLPATTLSVRPDTAWRFSASTPAADAGGLLQGAALEVGAGRVVVFGEAAQFRPPIGDLAGDNGRYARNVIAWLAGALEPMAAEPDAAQASEGPSSGSRTSRTRGR